MERAPRRAAAALSIPVRPSPDAARCVPAPAESAHAAALALAERRAREVVRATPSTASLPTGRSSNTASSCPSGAATPRHKLSGATAPSLLALGPISEHPVASSGFSSLLDRSRQRSGGSSDADKGGTTSAASRLISRLQSFTDSEDSQSNSESRGYLSKLDSIANWFKSSDSGSKTQTGGDAAATVSDGAIAATSSLFGGRLTALREQYRVAHVDFERERGELRLLRTYLDHLRREYAEAKQLDVVRRYGKLKVMIKRAVMYLKLSNNELVDLHGIGSPTSPMSPNGGSSWAPKRATSNSDLNRQKKIAPSQDNISKKSAEELEIELAATKASMADVSRRVRAIKQCIEELEAQYERSKRVSPLLRYSLLKRMVKSVFENPVVKE